MAPKRVVHFPLRWAALLIALVVCVVVALNVYVVALFHGPRAEQPRLRELQGVDVSWPPGACVPVCVCVCVCVYV